MSRNKCATCAKNVVKNDMGVQCGVCLNWWHAKCEDISELNYVFLKDRQTHWYCKGCNAGALKIHQQLTLLQTQHTELATEMKEMKNNMVSKKELDNSIKTAMSAEKKSFHTEIKKAVERGIKENLDSIKAEIGSRKEGEDTNLPSASSDLNLQQKVRESLSEFLDIQDRKTNLVLHRVPENDENDKDKIIHILSKMDIKEGQQAIKATKRLGKKVEGKNRPLLLTLVSEDWIRKIFQNVRKLQTAEIDISITRDLPKDTRKYREKLINEAKAAKGKDQDLFLYRITGPPGKERVVTKEIPKTDTTTEEEMPDLEPTPDQEMPEPDQTKVTEMAQKVTAQETKDAEPPTQEQKDPPTQQTVKTD